MKRIAFLIPTLAAAMMINALPSFSGEGYEAGWGTTTGVQEQTTGQKDECLLLAKNCPDAVDSIQQRIDKLQKEIYKGTDVYTTEELNILKQKLDDANSLLSNMNEGG
jgi:hypothetical protein